MSVVFLKGQEESLRVGKIICVGRNFMEHVKEMGVQSEATPVIFFKPPSSIVHDGGAVRYPDISKNLQHEVEMTVLIGRDGRNIPEEKALDYVLGYGVGLDMTLRDLQSEAKAKGLPWAIAKGFDTSAPVSSFFPANRIKGNKDLEIRLSVNGSVRQRGKTRDFVFSVQHLIAYISRHFTFERGDILFTGTPEGVARVSPGDQLHAELIDSFEVTLASFRVHVETDKRD